jgi:SAM-dependent methyltransferase
MSSAQTISVAPAAAPGPVSGAVLNLGCGRKHMANAVNLDVTAATSPDVVHDLNVVPWPFADNQFREVYAYDVIEHLDDILRTMDEIHRICRQGARVFVTVPHFSCSNAFTDPTHRHYFGWFSFDYFTEAHELSFYSRARFRIARRLLVFHKTLVNKIVWRLAHRFPAAYERRWAWMFPGWFLSFELEVLKEEGQGPFGLLGTT